MIRSEPFGGLLLTCEDAEIFLEQLRNYQPNAAADASKRRAQKMAQEFEKTGVITIRPRRARTKT